MGDFLQMARDLLLRSRSDFVDFSTVSVDAKRMTAGTTGDITLRTGLADGTPLGGTIAPGNRKTLKLKKPVLSFRNGRLRGAATLSVPGSYPSRYATPLDVDISIIDSGLSLSQTPLVLKAGGAVGDVSGSISARGRVLPEAHVRGRARMLFILTTDWKLKLSYDPRRLAGAMEQVVSQGADRTSLRNLASEASHPGLDLSAVTRAALPALGNVPISKVSLSAPTTRPLDNPLLGAALPFPYRYNWKGFFPTPPGTLFDVWALGLGFSRAEFGADRGWSTSLAVLPTISVEGKNLVEKIPVYGYFEYYQIHRVSDGLEVGFRLTMAPSSVDISRLKGSSKQDDDTLSALLQASRSFEDKARDKSMISFEIVGRHDWLGGSGD